jgi:hypothetical protein
MPIPRTPSSGGEPAREGGHIDAFTCRHAASASRVQPDRQRLHRRLTLRTHGAVGGTQHIDRVVVADHQAVEAAR